MIDLDAEIELLRQRIWKLRAEQQTVLDHKDAEIERLTAELGDLPEAQAMLLSDCKRKDTLLRRAIAVICWKCFGECRMQGVADLPTASEIEAEIKTELGEI